MFRVRIWKLACERVGRVIHSKEETKPSSFQEFKLRKHYFENNIKLFYVLLLKKHSAKLDAAINKYFQ